MASVDRGASVQFFHAQDKGAQAYTIHQPSSSRGSYDDPNVLTDYNVHGPHDHGPSFPLPEGGSVLVGVTAKVVYYKMQGWYAAGNVYEDWVTPNAPSASPPSGHALSDITLVGSLVV